MKKNSSLILLLFAFNFLTAQNYQSELKRVNEYLKTFDNGYYGYLEIKDGYLYNRFKDGTNYCKSKMDNLDYAFEKEKNHKIDIICKGNNTCVFSTFTNQNYNSFSFSQNNNFNTTPLISLFNDLISAYNKKNTSTNNSNISDDLDKYKSNIDLMSSGAPTSSAKNVSSGNYQSELKKLNDYLKTFDNGYYGYIEIKDGYLYDRFKSGEHSKTLISDLSNAEVEIANQKVKIRCKSNSACVYSTYTNSYHEQISFSQSTNFNTSILIDLLNNLLTAYKLNPQNSIKNNDINVNYTSSRTEVEQQTDKKASNTTNANYQVSLKKLNDYLKSFDNGYYGYFEVKDGYIYDRFKAGRYNKFKMEDIQGAEIQEQYSRVIFKCKTGTCISTDWKENGKEEYTQFVTNGAYNYQELADLLNDFRAAYLGNKTSNSNTSSVKVSNIDTQKTREQKARERQEKSSKEKEIEDEDFDAMMEAISLNTSVKTSQEAAKIKNIKSGTKIKLLSVYEKSDSYKPAQPYIGKIGITEGELYCSGDWYTGKVKFIDDNKILQLSSAKVEIVNENSTININPPKYTTALKNLNDYLKTFNAETYRDIEA